MTGAGSEGRPGPPLGGTAPGVADPSDPIAAFDDAEYAAALTARALDLLRSEFSPGTWRAFWATAAEGRPAADVAAQLGLTPNAVYLARARVLARLRAELAGLLD